MTIMLIEAVGIDAAFANMGFARVIIDTSKLDGAEPWRAIKCTSMHLETTQAEDKKLVRKSSDRLRRGQELREAMLKACSCMTFAFVEIPSGTQNANAAFGLGIAVGILAGCSIPIIEVSQQEVKEAIAGYKVKQGASKAEIIEWAALRWPDAPWLRAKHKAVSKGKTLLANRLLAENEHLADAMASVLAGVKTPEFKRLISLMAATNAIPTTSTRRRVLT